MKLYFARHGHTDGSAASPIDPSTGEINEPLNPEGMAQATKLADQLKGVHFDAIISSPLKRAHQTAEIVNQYHNMQIEVDPQWREREIGAYTDLETWTKLFDFDQQFSLEHSEHLKDFVDRIHHAINELKQQYEAKPVLIVSHIGVYLALEAYINHLPWKGRLNVSSLGNGEYRQYDIE